MAENQGFGVLEGAEHAANDGLGRLAGTQLQLRVPGR